MQGESFHLFAVDLLNRLPIKSSNTPTLLIAAEDDSFFSVGAQKATASIIKSDFKTVPNSGHDIMLDFKKQDAAYLIDRWLKYNIKH